MKNGVFGMDMGGADNNELDIQEVEETTSVNDDPNEGEGQPEQGPEQSLTEGQPQEAENAVDPSFGGRFKSPEDLAKSYRELERLKGQQGQRIGQLEQQVMQAAQVLQQMQAQMQGATMQQQQQQQMQVPTQAPVQQQVDPEKWLESFYENPTESIKSILRAELAEEGKSLGQALQQVIAPMQQYMANEVTSKELTRRYTQAQQTIPDFEELRYDAAKVIEEVPQLAMMPDGLNRAFEIARGRRMQMQYATQPQQLQQQAPNPKEALRIPSSSGTRPGQQPSYEDMVRANVFGAGKTTPGVFD